MRHRHILAETGRRFARGLFAHGHLGGHHRHGGRSGRIFDHGDLRWVVLQLIADKPRHGYDIIKAIEELAGGSYTPSPGTVYPTLTLLEELGHISVTPGEGARKLHSITEAGQTALAAQRDVIDAIFARLNETGPAHGPAPQILRAMANLKLALRLRLGRGRASEADINAIARALDAATIAIEQL